MSPLSTLNGAERLLRLAKLVLSIVGALGGGLIAVSIWLVNQHFDIGQLKTDDTNLIARLNQLDQQGTRGMDLVRSRQQDLLTGQATLEARLRDLEMRLSENQRLLNENRFLVDQILTYYGRGRDPTRPIPPGERN